MAEKHTHGADASSSEDEFVDFEDDGWLEQYTSEDEGECFTTAHHPDGVSEAASSPPPSPATPRANGSMPPAGSSNGKSPKDKGKSRSDEYSAPKTPKASSSRRSVPDIESGLDTDTEEDLGSLGDKFAKLKTNDNYTPATPLGRTNTQPTVSPSPSSPISPARMAYRNRLVSEIMSSPMPSPPASPSPAGTTRGTSGRSNLSRAATMPSPNTVPLSATPPLPRSNSMGEQETDTAAPSPTAGMRDGYVCIAHQRDVQTTMDKFSVAWDVQYELARGVSAGLWSWDDVTQAKLRALTTQRKKPYPAQYVSEVMGKNISGQKLEIWAELEREQSAIIENATRGLGLLGDWKGETNWYGGRIQQIARLDKTSGEYRLQLGAMQKVKLPPKVLYDQTEMQLLRGFLSKKFVLCGRVYAAFSVKDEKVYLVETNEDYERSPKDDAGDNHRCSLRDLVEWYNPLDLNSNQNLSKYAARADLAMSTSVPVLEFSPQNIHKIDDIYAPHSGGGKVPAEKIFTDGCGYMNGAALMKIGSWMGFGTPPTAVQGRVLGSKGVWMLHPTDRAPDAEPKIWIRPSQMKIQLVEPATFGPDSLATLHRAHRIFDLVMPSRSTVPARLSRLTIVNLEYNGVPAEVLIKLMKTGLKQEVETLTQWNGASAMPLLWNAVNKASAVSFQRLRRTAAGIQRALGLTRRRNEDDPEDDDDLEEARPGSAPTDPNLQEEERPKDVDMPPLSIAEGIMERIQAGFSPLADYHLYGDLKTLLTQIMKSYIKEYHIVVPESAEAFIVPDPYGVLAEDEIHYKSSQDLKDGCLHLNPKSVTGEVLIYRNPARVPSDIQKVRAVCRPELADYIDVIVLPTKGKRSLASLLAGGDVDGDVAACIFDQDIVQAFNTPAITEEPPNFLRKYFEPLDKIPTVASVVQEMDMRTTADAEDLLRRHLLIGLSESKVGKYSMFHENAIYSLGYDDPETRRLAFMFTTVLDSRKSGLVVKRYVLQADEKHGFGKPVCLGGSDTARNIPRRPPVLGLFILEALLEAGDDIQRELLVMYSRMGRRLAQGSTDADILRPWQSIQSAKRAKRLPEIVEREVEILKEHVDKARQEWAAIWSRPNGNNQYSQSTKEEINIAKKNEKERVLSLAKRYAQVPEGCNTLALLGNIETLKASYAYSLSPKLALKVAFQALCKIKAETAGTTAFTKEFAEAMAISASEVRVRSQFNAVENFEYAGDGRFVP